MRGYAGGSLCVPTRHGTQRGAVMGPFGCLHLREVALVTRLARVDLSTPYHDIDFYCDVAIPFAAQLSVVHDDERVLAFHHTRPFWETHIVVVPKRHIASFTSVTAADEQDMRALFSAVQRVAGGVETAKGAAAVLTNLGVYQDSKHLHVHVHSGPELARP